MAIAADDAQCFHLRGQFGIIPAVISPFVARRRPAHALRIFQSAERSTPPAPLAMGPGRSAGCRTSTPPVARCLAEQPVSCAPDAQKAARIRRRVDGRPIDDAVSEETAQRIARRRATDEAGTASPPFSTNARLPGFA